MRHVSRTHRVHLDWIYDLGSADDFAHLRYVNTREQIADMLTAFQQPGNLGYSYVACLVARPISLHHPISIKLSSCCQRSLLVSELSLCWPRSSRAARRSHPRRLFPRRWPPGQQQRRRNAVRAPGDRWRTGGTLRRAPGDQQRAETCYQPSTSPS